MHRFDHSPSPHPAVGSLRRKLTLIAFALLLSVMSLILFRFERTIVVQQEPTDTETNDFRQPCSDKVIPSIQNIEDFDWVYCSLDLGPFWSSLQIVDNRFTDSSSLTEAFSVYGDLDRDGNDEWILRLTLRTVTDQATRFVLLKHDLPSGRWKPLGHLDIAQFHLAPEARIVSNGRASWLAIAEHEKAWSDSFRLENETWYELTDRGLMEVLSFPAESEADHVETKMREEIKTDVHLIPFEGTRDEVEVVYARTLRSTDRDPIIVRRKVSFSKEPLSSVFLFDPSRSEITEAEYRSISEIQK